MCTFDGLALKALRDTSNFILVWASEPYVQLFGVLRVRNTQSGVLTMDESREKCRGSTILIEVCTPSD